MANERRNVARSIVHSLLGTVQRTVAARSQLYMRASSPNDPPGRYSRTFCPSTKAFSFHQIPDDEKNVKKNVQQKTNGGGGINGRTRTVLSRQQQEVVTLSINFTRLPNITHVRYLIIYPPIENKKLQDDGIRAVDSVVR